jgi:hypothetical protein
VPDIEDRLESTITKLVSKLIPKKFFVKPVPQQVKIAKRLIGMSSMESVRRSMLKDTGMPSDIRDMLKEGKNREEIKDFYWQHIEFREFWTVDLAMEEATLDELIRGIVD